MQVVRAEVPAEYDSSKIITQMISDEQCNAMFVKLFDELVPPHEWVATLPKYTDLFFDHMIPEWALLIFMAKYDVKRAEALDQLQKQGETVMYTKYASDSY